MHAETARLLRFYIAAFNQDPCDFDAMDQVLREAQNNRELEEFIKRYHAETTEEVHLSPDQWAKLQAIIQSAGRQS